VPRGARAATALGAEKEEEEAEEVEAEALEADGAGPNCDGGLYAVRAEAGGNERWAAPTPSEPPEPAAEEVEAGAGADGPPLFCCWESVGG
jgi:hypothetical protein